MTLFNLFLFGYDSFKLFFLSIVAIAILTWLLSQTIFNGEINKQTENILFIFFFLIFFIQGYSIASAMILLMLLLNYYRMKLERTSKFALLKYATLILFLIFGIISAFIVGEKDGLYVIAMSTVLFLIYLSKNEELSYWLSSITICLACLFPLVSFMYLLVLFVWFATIFRITDVSDKSNAMNRLMYNLFKFSIESTELQWRIRNKIKTEWQLSYAILSSILSLFIAVTFYFCIYQEFSLVLWGTIVYIFVFISVFFVMKYQYHSREADKPTEMKYIDKNDLF